MPGIGRIVRFTTEGTMIVRSQQAPPIGRIVCDNRGRDLGRIVRVTGPVSAPFVIIRPKGSLPEGTNKLLGREVFLSRTRESPEYKPRTGSKRRPDKGPVPGRGEGGERRKVHRSRDRGS